jgi:biopolymer transport protein ExbB
MSATLAGYLRGGPITLAILLVGLIGLAIIVERGYVIVFRSRINGRPFIERVIQLVRGGKIDEAIKACAGSTAALPDMGLLILRSRSRDESDLQNVASAAALAVVPKLTRRIQYLPTLALIALLLGDAGAVHGVREALLATAAPGADHSERLSAGLSAGLAAALSPGELGLGVAIVLILGRAYLVSQSESITEQIHEFSARLINALIDRPDVRLGHR